MIPDKDLNMKYTLGEVSELLDVTKSTIRNYEKHGLLKAHRNEANDYRTFTEEDVWILREIRAFRQLHFSVEEIGGLLGNMDRAAMQTMLVEKRRLLISEAKILLKQVEKIEKLEEKLGEAVAQEPVLISPMPDFYWLPMQESLPESQLEWAEYMPYTFISPRFQRVEGQWTMRMGIGISKADQQEQGLSLPLDVVCIQAEQAWASVAKSGGNQPEDQLEVLNEMIIAAEKAGFQCSGPVFVQGMITLKEKVGKDYFSRYWMPVVPLKSESQ